LSILSYCLEYLHRHPLEVDLPMHAIMQIAAYDRIKTDEIKRA